MDVACEINEPAQNDQGNSDGFAVQVDLIPSKLPKPTQNVLDRTVTDESVNSDTVLKQEAVSPEEKTCHVVFEVGIQANDYEIERSGKVPSRKRLVPFKFRDYRNPDNIDPDKSDSDYDPGEDLRSIKKKRKPGRPKRVISGKETVSSYANGDNADKIDAASKSRGFACNQCHKIFSQKGNLNVHIKLHTDDRPFACDFESCNKRFRSNETLRRHKLTHIGMKPFVCELCKNRFSSKVSLTEHMARHADIRPHSCDKCDKKFRQISCLKRHLVTHTSDTPYSCQTCGKKFSQMAYLRSHNKVHTGEKPFSCDQCNKSFAHGSDLTRHKIIHSGEKPFRCSYCSHQFSDRSSCRRHIKEHMSSKPYTCNLCGDGFKRTGQLRAHLARQHFTKEDDIVKKEPEDDLHTLRRGHDNPGVIDLNSVESQRKIVSLIKNLNSNILVQQIEIASPDKSSNVENETTYVEEINVASVTDTDLIQLSQAVENPVNHLEIPLQELPVMSSDGNTEKTVIAITDTDGKLVDGGSLPLECTYKIIRGLAANSIEEEIYEVHYQDHEEPSKPDTSSTEIAPDYVANPDFSCQEYYNWLSNFTELCKMVPMPLDLSLFQKMSQVHKALSDVMATPSGVVADKDNFRVLMTISRDLNMIISEHLNFVLQNLDDTITS